MPPTFLAKGCSLRSLKLGFVTPLQQSSFQPFSCSSLQLSQDTMLAQRALIRPVRRLPRQLPTKRSYASHEPNLQGVQDNAFNRERAAVKHHAEQTSSITSFSNVPYHHFIRCPSPLQ